MAADKLFNAIRPNFEKYVMRVVVGRGSGDGRPKKYAKYCSDFPLVCRRYFPVNDEIVFPPPPQPPCIVRERVFDFSIGKFDNSIRQYFHGAFIRYAPTVG